MRYWALWWTLLAAAVVVFYGLLTPFWLGMRLVARVADANARARGR